MDLTRFEQARDLIKQAQSKVISLRDLDNGLLDLVWGIEPVEDVNVVHLAGPILLVMAELDRGHRSEEDVYATIDEQLRNVTIHWEREPRRRMTAASGRTIKREPFTRVVPAWFASEPIRVRVPA